MNAGSMKRYLAYAGYALVVAGICLWAYFPYTAWVNARIARQELNTVRVRVAQASPLLPLGLEAGELHVAWLNVPGVPPVKIEDFRFRISPLSFIRKAWDASARGRLFGGKVEVTGQVAPRKKPDHYDGHVSFDGVKLAGLLAGMAQLEHVAGTVTGDVTLKSTLKSIVKGTGNATLSLEGVQFAMETPMSGSIDVQDGQGKVNVQLGKGRVKILTCQFTCKGMKGKVFGSISLRQPLIQSGLNLIVSLTPDDSAKKQFPAAALIMQPGTTYKVHLSGIIGNPRFKLVG